MNPNALSPIRPTRPFRPSHYYLAMLRCSIRLAPSSSHTDALLRRVRGASTNQRAEGRRELPT